MSPSLTCPVRVSDALDRASSRPWLYNRNSEQALPSVRGSPHEQDKRKRPDATTTTKLSLSEARSASSESGGISKCTDSPPNTLEMSPNQQGKPSATANHASRGVRARDDCNDDNEKRRRADSRFSQLRHGRNLAGA